MRPTLVLNPRRDEAFEAAVAALMDGATSPSMLQERLRATYPRAVVRARELSSEPMVVWYVYRDGHWIRGRDRT